MNQPINQKRTALAMSVFILLAMILPINMSIAQARSSSTGFENGVCPLDWTADILVADSGVGEQTLAIGQGPSANDDLNDWCDEARMPPKPPAGAFDARLILPNMLDASKKDFRSSLSSTVTWRMEFQPGAGGYPFTFTWVQAALPAGTWRLQDSFGGIMINVDMTAQDSYVLDSADYNALVIRFTAAQPRLPLYLPLVRR